MASSSLLAYPPSDDETEQASPPPMARDRVVKTIPMYLSHALAPYLFQYPIHSSSSSSQRNSSPLTIPITADMNSKITSRFKPKTSGFELNIPLDTREIIFNEEKSREAAKGLDINGERYEAKKVVKGAKKEEIEMAEGLVAQKLVASVVPDQTIYMAGVMRHGE